MLRFVLCTKKPSKIDCLTRARINIVTSTHTDYVVFPHQIILNSKDTTQWKKNKYHCVQRSTAPVQAPHGARWVKESGFSAVRMNIRELLQSQEISGKVFKLLHLIPAPPLPGPPWFCQETSSTSAILPGKSRHFPQFSEHFLNPVFLGPEFSAPEFGVSLYKVFGKILKIDMTID
jgi:hypothetical protein